MILLNKFRYLSCRRNAKSLFTDYYKSNEWGDRDSVSGPGSNLAQTIKIRNTIPELILRFGISSILDLACGDFFWMKEIDLGAVRYVGGDIVDELVSQNNKQYGGNNRVFDNIDLLSDKLPKTDLILLRDCLVHLPYAEIRCALANVVKSESCYLLTTTFTARKNNVDIEIGAWRPINLMVEPFNFPPPLEIINEGCTEGSGGEYSDKSLGLWKIQDLRSVVT